MNSAAVYSIRFSRSYGRKAELRSLVKIKTVHVSVCMLCFSEYRSLVAVKSRIKNFPHGATAPSAPGPPHYRGFTITLRDTTLGATPLHV
jgi:hypothetical protein